MIRHVSVVSAVAMAALVSLGCTRSDGAASNDAGAEASVGAIAPAPSAPAVDAAAPDAATHVTSKPAEKTEIECRAKNEAGLIELDLAWTQNTATGTLKVDGKSRPVEATRWKGDVLVNPPHKPENADRIATVSQNNGPKKQIQAGDWHQPWLDCL